MTFANAAAARLFGKSEEQIMGNPVVWVMPDERVLGALRASRDDGIKDAHFHPRPHVSCGAYQWN